MSIAKHDVMFNHDILHVVAWVKAKQLTSGYIPLKSIHLFLSLSCRLLGISKDRDILAKYFVAFGAGFTDMNHAFNLLRLIIDDLQNKNIFYFFCSKTGVNAK